MTLSRAAAPPFDDAPTAPFDDERSGIRTRPLLLGKGTVLDDKYQLVRPLGRGGMSVVWEAEHVLLGRRRAVKLAADGAQDEIEAAVRIIREARFLSRLQSRHIVRVIDIHHHEETTFIAMELLEGNDLAHELDALGPLPVADAVDYTLQASGALAEAHDRGIVHRDVKPANLFRAREGEDIVIKLFDFGVARDLHDRGPRLTLPTLTVGTTAYSSPEQRMGDGGDASADVFSLGLTLLELVTGDLVLDSAAAASLPPELVAVIRRMITWRAEERPSILEAARALAPFARRGSLGRVAAGVAASRFGT